VETLADFLGGLVFWSQVEGQGMTTYIDSFEELEGVFKDIDKAFGAIEYAPVFEEQIGKLLDEHTEHFAQEKDSTGTMWNELAASTIARKGHDTILFETGKLKASLTTRGGGGQILDEIHEGMFHGLVFGTDVEYAGIHQFSSGRMQRPPVGLSDHYIEQLENAIMDFVVEGLKEKKQSTR